MKSDANGFLIADRAISVESLSKAMGGVKSDTGAILALLKVGTRANQSARARVLNSGASRSSAQAARGIGPAASPTRDEPVKSLARIAAALARDRDERGRFLPVTAELSEVTKAVRDMTRTQAKQHAEEKRERAKTASRGGSAQYGTTGGPSGAPQGSGSNSGGRPARGPQSGSATPVAPGSNGNAGTNATNAASAPNTTNADATRDSRGRFIGRGGGRAGGAGSGGADDDEPGGGSGGAGDRARGRRKRDGEGFFSRLKGLFKDVKTPGLPGTDGYEKVDPTVEASKELGNLVKAPLQAVGTVGKAVIGRGFGGAKNASVSWFRRILKELHLTRTQAGDFAATETRVLKDIERKTGGGSAAAKGGLLGSIMGGLGGMLGKGGGGIMSLLGGGMKLGKGLFKRLPLLGALFAGGSALASMFGGDDPNKTAEQNRTDRFTGAGSGIGSLVGGGIGMLLGGPVGAMIGGVIGDKVGELVGGWLSTVDWGKVGDTITGAWDTAVATVTDTWKKVTDTLGGVVTTVENTWNAILGAAKAFLKDKFGVDVDAIIAKTKETVAPAVDYVKEKAKPVVEAVSAGVDAAKNAGGAAVDYAKERVTKMAAPIGTAVGNAVDFGKGIFGGGSKGRRDAVMAQAQNIADPNERAAFLAQADHESGGFRNDEENLHYSAKGLRKTFGKYYKTDAEAQADANNPEAIANKVYGGRMGNTEAGDGYKFRGRGAIQLTGREKYAEASKALGIDLVNNPDLMKDPAISAKVAMWYWTSTKGLAEAGRAGNDELVRKKVNGGLNGLDDTKAKTASYLAAIKAGDPSVASPSLPSPNVTVAAAAPPPPAPVPAAPPAPVTAPPTVQAAIPQPMNTAAPIDVRVSNDTAVGQDLSDRRFAQIATGGISA